LIMYSIYKTFLRILRMMVVPGIGGGIVVLASLYLYLSPNLPSVETLKSVQLQTPLRIYTQNKQLIGEFGEIRRIPVDFAAIPQNFIYAVLAAEDDAFYHHFGVDLTGLLRAGLELVGTGSIQSGGSTITMQVARNFFLTREQSFIRKFNEILLALRIEDELTKDEIFALYANKIYLGNRAYGIGAAAYTYYGRPIEALALAEIAMLAGLPKAPSALNPLINPDRAIERRNWILGRMLKLRFIAPAEHADAISSPVTAAYHGTDIATSAPYAAEEARLEALNILGPAAYTDGYVVITTIDGRLQQSADRAVKRGLIAYDWRHGYRGPEAHITNPEDWTTSLAATPAIGDQQPAIVAELSDNALVVITKSRGKIVIPATNKSLTSLRLHVSEDRVGPPLKTLADIFKPGSLIRIRFDELDKPHIGQLPAAQAALVSIAPDTGAIKAMVGGYDFSQSHFNRISQARRQPGSNFKPFIYTAALERGMSAASIINDAPVVFEGSLKEKAWRPENSNGEFYGPTRLREALYRSRNLVSIRILRWIGVDAALETLKKFGFDSKQLPQDLSLALGSNTLTPLELATGYATFANGGYKVESYLIERIERVDGQVVFQSSHPAVCRDCEQMGKKPESSTGDIASISRRVSGAVIDSDFSAVDKITDAEPLETVQFTATNNSSGEKNSEIRSNKSAYDARATHRPHAQRIVEPRVAYLMDSMLKDVIRYGTGSKAKALNRSDLAGKTGTTNGPRDAWFSGYNPDLVTTVWLGFDDNGLLGTREFGGSAALPIWMDYVASALAGSEEKSRPRPPGLVSVKIDPLTGLRSNANDGAIFELFREENVPASIDARREALGETRALGHLPEDIF
jgi:penicillin-binding protein 1A